MGMTIDEHISQLKKLKSFHNGSYGASINFAIDTMRKYQKIETIIEMWKEDRKRFTLGDNGSKDEYLRQISEVLEDEKND